MANKLKFPPFHLLDAIYTPCSDFNNALTAMEKDWGGGGVKIDRHLPHFVSQPWYIRLLLQEKNMNYIHQYSKSSQQSGGLVELWLVSFSIYSKKKRRGGLKIPRRDILAPFFRFQFYIHKGIVFFINEI